MKEFSLYTIVVVLAFFAAGCHTPVRKEQTREATYRCYGIYVREPGDTRPMIDDTSVTVIVHVYWNKLGWAMMMEDDSTATAAGKSYIILYDSASDGTYRLNTATMTRKRMQYPAMYRGNLQATLTDSTEEMTTYGRVINYTFCHRASEGISMQDTICGQQIGIAPSYSSRRLTTTLLGIVDIHGYDTDHLLVRLDASDPQARSGGRIRIELIQIRDHDVPDLVSDGIRCLETYREVDPL